MMVFPFTKENGKFAWEHTDNCTQLFTYPGSNSTSSSSTDLRTSDLGKLLNFSITDPNCMTMINFTFLWQAFESIYNYYYTVTSKHHEMFVNVFENITAYFE